MNIVAIGELLQTLRKEKGLTQEQLAEKLNVARRTVSRWETGSNLPDLDILIELSDFYDIGLRDLLAGERKSENMNEELRETVLQVADYTNEDKARLLQRMHWLYLAGTVGFVIFLVTVVFNLQETAPYEAIGSFGLGIAFGTVILGVIFTGKSAEKIRAAKMRVLERIGK